MSARGADISIRKDERGKGEMKKREREKEALYRVRQKLIRRYINAAWP